MYYELNVSLHGQHFFATAERSIQTLDRARTLFLLFRQTFKAEDGYAITVTQWETTGRGVAFDYDGTIKAVR